jgi:hypothetical protein
LHFGLNIPGQLEARSQTSLELFNDIQNDD